MRDSFGVMNETKNNPKQSKNMSTASKDQFKFVKDELKRIDNAVATEKNKNSETKKATDEIV